MKLIVERSHLLAGLKAVGHLAGGKADIPILGHVRLMAEQDRMSIAATDLDAYAETDIAAEVERPGGAALPAGTLLRMVSNFPDGAQVMIDAGDAVAIVKAGRSRYQVPVLPAGDFPSPFPMAETAACFSLTPEEVARLFDLPRDASAKGSTAYRYLEGIFLHGPIPGESDMRGVGLNGHVMLSANIPPPPGSDTLPRNANAYPSVLIPLESAAHLVRMGKAGLDLRITGSVLAASSAGAVRMRYWTKLVENTYPPYAKLVPDLDGPHVVVDGGALSAAVERLAGMAGDENRSVAIEWGEDGDLQLWLDDLAGAVYGTETIEIERREGTARVGVRAGYVMKVVSAVGHGRLEIWSRDESKTIRLRNIDDPALIACISPQILRRRPHHEVAGASADAEATP